MLSWQLTRHRSSGFSPMSDTVARLHRSSRDAVMRWHCYWSWRKFAKFATASVPTEELAFFLDRKFSLAIQRGDAAGVFGTLPIGLPYLILFSFRFFYYKFKIIFNFIIQWNSILGQKTAGILIRMSYIRLSTDRLQSTITYCLHRLLRNPRKNEIEWCNSKPNIMRPKTVIIMF